MKKIISSILCLIMLFACCLSIVSCGASQKKADDYATALAKIIDGDYEGAKALFEQLGSYKDSEKYLENFYYMPTKIGFNLIDRAGSIDVLYNGMNLPLKEISHREDMERTTEFEYDENGNIVKQIAIINGEVSTYTYVYNEIGLYDYAHYVGADGSECTYDYTYNEKGYRITETYSDSYENSYVCSFTYDDNGNLTRMAYEVGDEVHSLDITYTFDEKDNLTKKVCNYSDGVEEILEYTYDEKGREIKCVFEAYDDSVSTFDYTYDDNGNLIKTVCTDSDGVRQSADYDYKLLYLPKGFTEGSYYFFSGYWTSTLSPIEYFQ